MQLLLLAVVATPLIAFWPKGNQDPDQWLKHVTKACESRRFGIRLAAAKRVANAGAAAVPAIKAYSKDKGRNAVPTSLVDAIADSEVASPETEVLLRTWAEDNEFYWRSNAMRGLALRRVEASLFDKYVGDSAWLMRTHARFGLALLAEDGKGRDAVFAMAEGDPRARVRLARLLLEQGKVPPLQPLLDALGDQRTFLGIPWGSRLGLESSKALNAWLGADYPKTVGGDYQKSIGPIVAAAKKRSGQDLKHPETKSDPNHDVVGGFEIASCKFGDQFVQWQPDGTLRFGIDGARTAKLPAAQWQELLQQRTALVLDKNVGVVVCDKMQLVLLDPKTRVDVAPSSLPNAASEWLKRLTQRLEEANETELAADLRRGLGQFEGR